MREISEPVAEPVEPDENLTDVVWANADRFPETVGLRRRVDGGWLDVTCADFAAQVSAVAKGLMAAGVAPGDRVALLSKTRYEWTLLDYAIWAAGGATVPVYETSSAEQIEWILADSGARAVVVETPAHREVVRGLVDRLPAVQHLWQIEPPTEPGAAAAVVDELTALGAEVTDAELTARRRGVTADDLATLIYTSGTTGRPKGCELTHANLLADIRAGLGAFPRLLQSAGSVLLFLPLAHVFARVIQCGAVYARTTLGHTADVSDLLGDLAEFRPTFVLAVPRVFEKVYNGAKQRAHADGRGRIFDAAQDTAIAWSRALDTGGPGLTLRAKHAVFDRLVYTRLRAALGGRCIAAVSVGSPLVERLGHFFRGIGVPVLEGYGLTETTAATTVNTESNARVGSVGRPVAGVSLRIADDGEVLVAGPTVFRRYRNNPEATAEAIVDGWFHTGDLGSLDEQGFLHITGRKKEIIVTAGGKNVAPAVLEDRVRAHPLVSQCVVVGDQRRFVAALVTIDSEALPAWCVEHDLSPETTVADLVDHPRVLAEVQSAVDDANRAVSHTEAIKKFAVLPVDLTEAGGQLTPTLKIKRAVVATEFAADIEALYAD